MKWISALLIISIYAHTISTPEPELSTPVSVPEVEIDTRVDSLESYLSSKNSPLSGSALDFIQISDHYSIDWTLLPAIAGVESGFETAGNTSDFNPFGYMCEDRPCRFLSYSEGIARVGRTLGENRSYSSWRSTGSLLELAKTYNHVSPEDWARKVRYFQQQIKGGE